MTENLLKEVKNEVKYHVVPDLTPEQIKELKTTAIRMELSVKELVKKAILDYITIVKAIRRESQ